MKNLFLSIAVLSCSSAFAKGANVKDIQNAGAIVYEVGVADQAFGKVHTPTARIYLCVDKSGNATDGKLDVNLASLGLGPYQKTLTSRETKQVSEIWQATDITVHYKITGQFDSDDKSGDHAGHITFEAISAPNWKRTFPLNSIEQKKLGQIEMSPIFNFINDGTDKTNSTVRYYEVDKKTFYIVAYAFPNSIVKGAIKSVVQDCENEKKPVFVKLGDDLKPKNPPQQKPTRRPNLK